MVTTRVMRTICTTLSLHIPGSRTVPQLSKRRNKSCVVQRSLSPFQLSWHRGTSRSSCREVICYSDVFADFAYRDIDYCGSQITPGLYELVDVADIQGLIAPRPLLVDIGTYDGCFRPESALSCYERVQEIYAAAEAADSLSATLFLAATAGPGTSRSTSSAVTWSTLGKLIRSTRSIRESDLDWKRTAARSPEHSLGRYFRMQSESPMDWLPPWMRPARAIRRSRAPTPLGDTLGSRAVPWTALVYAPRNRHVAERVEQLRSHQRRRDGYD